jgi:hypothetical protein
VYDSASNLIESYSLTFFESYVANTGQFLGFSESSANISYFVLTDNYIGITELTVGQGGGQVPEPGTLLRQPPDCSCLPARSAARSRRLSGAEERRTGQPLQDGNR